MLKSDGFTEIRMSLAEARRIVGSLSFPSKLPSTSFDIPATACVVGSKFAKIPGTACSQCYALGGKAKYQMANAVKGSQRRLAGLHHPLWVLAMVRLLAHYHSKPRIKVDLGITGLRLQRKGGSRFRWNEPGFHRWHGSGDLQSTEHFAAICSVAAATPKIAHWLPTQELGMVKEYLKRGGSIPDNLVVRVSSIMVNDPVRRAWLTTSSVFGGEPPADAWKCPAPSQGHVCGSCRACWSHDVAHVAYELH